MDLVITLLERLVPLALMVVGILLFRWAVKKGINEDYQTYLASAYETLRRAVLDTNQTWVDALKKANGGLTEEEKGIAREKTIALFKAMLTDEVEIAIDAAYGTVENWLGLNLEATVAEVHTNAPSVVNITSPTINTSDMSTLTEILKRNMPLAK